MIAERGHLPAIQQTPRLTLEALFDPRRERALEMQQRFQANHAYPTEEDFWRADFDAVVICTPAPLHLEHVTKAAAHGKHILCEKPLATVEMSFSYNASSKEPRSNFQYELIGTDGVIRFNREEHSFELRNSYGTQYLAWHPEKNFRGMYDELLYVLTHPDDRNMPLAHDGLVATRIAREATEQAIRERDAGSNTHHASMSKAESSQIKDLIPADSSEPGLDEPGLDEPVPLEVFNRTTKGSNG